MIINQLLSIVKLNFKDAIHDRASYTILISGLSMLFISIVFGKMAVGGGQRIIQNMGFWVFGLWGVFSVMYYGTKNLKNDIERKTIYLILSRPVSRPVYIIGLFLSTVTILFFLFLIFSALWICILTLWNIPFSSFHFIALGFIFGEWVLLASLSLFFITFTYPFTHNFFIFCIYLMGHLSQNLLRYAELTDIQWLKPVFNLLYFILPNLEALNFRTNALYGEPPEQKVLWFACLVLACWVSAGVLSANILFLNKKIR